MTYAALKPLTSVKLGKCCLLAYSTRHLAVIPNKTTIASYSVDLSFNLKDLVP